MEYIPGTIHESFQKLHALELLNDYNLPILQQRWSESNLIDDNSVNSLELLKGAVILVRFFKPSDCSTSYTFIESILSGDMEIKVMSETTLSREFVVQNTINDVLFYVVTKQYERDKKINSILDESL